MEYCSTAVLSASLDICGTKDQLQDRTGTGCLGLRWKSIGSSIRNVRHALGHSAIAVIRAILGNTAGVIGQIIAGTFSVINVTARSTAARQVIRHCVQ
ncbi:hypothetical protein QN372_16240 [Undibacterium sp. RTI2.1]|uniref:hypothetical protein n=1 Tax=unclassified Undibacterium TaxID=2630295 RepID=UPI002B236F54|nr:MULTISPECIES: hypothetical protein [unclassified Undibacterium]MEB0032307.1 hypothetical protein [Undibacterium sp. RTI2.1]MEB0118450.1 hypothetical protein [Undibacterium sp. RTI2.2]